MGWLEIEQTSESQTSKYVLGLKGLFDLKNLRNALQIQKTESMELYLEHNTNHFLSIKFLNERRQVSFLSTEPD
jgi:negative regulator of genetic competence, sporulation and motility